MSLPLLAYQTVHHFPIDAPLIAHEPFAYKGKEYIGVQPSNWEGSERGWDNGDPAYNPPNTLSREPYRGFGRWNGGGTIHVRPGNLSLVPLDATEVTTELVGHDLLARVEVGALLRATWERLRAIGDLFSGQVRVILQDAATGAFLHDVTLASFTIEQADLPAIVGDCILWARIVNAQREWLLPPDYLQVRGFSAVPDQYKYSEGSVDYIWDYIADVGRRPTDLAHPFYALEKAAFEAGELLHRGEWTQYITDGNLYGGPWSALRISVAPMGSSFVTGANFQPAPGHALYEVTGLNTRAAVLLDPLALSATAWKELEFGDEAGRARIGGTVASRNGPLTAYWDFDPDALGNSKGTILGVSELNFVPVCEASLYPVVSDIEELPPLQGQAVSRERIASFSHIYEYLPTALTVPQRLPGLPRETLGHPGGRCLRAVNTGEGHELRWFTEAFGGGIGATAQGGKVAQFYNRLCFLNARQQARNGTGTVFHGHNCADICWGDYYGWVQDKPFGDPNSRQYLSIMNNGLWDTGGMASFLAREYRWQRLRRLQTEQGTVLITQGKKPNDQPDSERAVWGLSDGRRFEPAFVPFRPRRLTPAKTAPGATTEVLYAVGRFTEIADDGFTSVTEQWSVIKLTGEFVKFCALWSWDDLAFVNDRSDAVALGLDVTRLKPYLWWQKIAGQPAGGRWLQRETLPDEGTPYLVTTLEADRILWKLPLGQPLPYNPNHFGKICFVVHDDGGTGTPPIDPETTCNEPHCVTEPPIICTTYNAGVFSFSLADALAAGLDTDELPTHLHWLANQPGETFVAGGAWRFAEGPAVGGVPYLTLSLTALTIDYTLTGALPYDPDEFSTLCFEVDDDGGTHGPWPPPPETVCFAWDKENDRFLVDEADALESGLNIAALPDFLTWETDPTQPLGGAWIEAVGVPLDTTPYLVFSQVGTVLYYTPGAGVPLPYNPLAYRRICFTVGPDGNPTPGPWPPVPSEIYPVIEQRPIPAGAVWNAIQVCDVNDFHKDTGLRELRYQGQEIPNLWGRIDSDEPQDDLTTYTIPLTWDRFVSLPAEAREKIEVVALCFEGSGPLRGPAIMRRN